MNNLIYELWDSPSKTISGLFHQPLSLYTPPLLLNLLVIVCIPQRTCLVLFPIGGTSNSNSFHNSRLIPPWGIKQDLCPCCVASLCRFKKILSLQLLEEIVTSYVWFLAVWLSNINIWYNVKSWLGQHALSELDLWPEFDMKGWKHIWPVIYSNNLKWLLSLLT